MNFPSQNLNNTFSKKLCSANTQKYSFQANNYMLYFLNMVYSAVYGSDTIYSQLILTKTRHLFMENNLNKSLDNKLVYFCA